ncbi:MAG: flagellar motor switch protein FliM [Phycisphaerae bacterium]|nr:flagellar motor switch protein FliM [Phycisphaerae bacterium]
MAEVLDQGEIDALLSAVEGQADENAPGEADGPAARTTAVANASIKPNKPVAIYDFKRPERVSKDHIRALAAIHDGFARNFGATLSGFLRTIIDVRVVGVEQLTYSEFVHSLPNPTCFVILTAPPLEGQMCLEISPLIVYPMVDRLLGGNGTDVFIPQRPLTSIEWRLIVRLVDRALTHLSEAWNNLVEVEFKKVQTDSNPQLIHIVAPTEVVVYITFEIKMGSSAGTMSMCIPFNVIESVLSKLTTQSWFGYRPKEATDQQRSMLLRNLSKTTVNMTGYLGATTVSLHELRNLRPGDIIQLDKQVHRDLILQIEGINKYAGKAGTFRGFRSLRLTRKAEADEIL